MSASEAARLAIFLVAGTGAVWMLGERVDGAGADTGLWRIFWRHTLAAVLLTWTFKEAILAAALLAAVNLALVFFDFLRGTSAIWTLGLTAMFSPAAAIPGTLLSWWRYSNLRTRHQLTAESAMYRSLSKELDGARRVHEAAMPRPMIHGSMRLHYVYEPYRQLGGDLIYLHPPQPKDGEPFVLLVLDVAGHGIAAALTVNRLIGELERMLAEGGTLTPAALAKGLNRYVRLTLASHGLFATALIVRIDPRVSRLTWVSCGHPTAFLVAPGKETRRLEAGSMMMGVTDEEDLGVVEQVEVFEPGSVLFACTDGATEARNPQGKALLTDGFEALLESVVGSGAKPADWCSAVAMRVSAHRAGPADDDTLVVAVAHGGIVGEAAVKRPAATTAQVR